MTAADVRAFYSALGIRLPDRPATDLPVRCFAHPDAHNHGDRTPSCSVSLTNGAWRCHGCGARGGAYDAALEVGLSRRAAMRLLVAHGLDQLGGADDSQEIRSTTRPGGRRHADRPQALDVCDRDIGAWMNSLQGNGQLLRRLGGERAWSTRAIRDLEVGHDGSRITIPIRSADRELRGVLRYDPFGPRNPKMLAASGTRLGLTPHPAQVSSEHVILVEGPPDMLAARSLGLPAIAVPGTHAWQTEWARLLSDRHVTIVMDCDRPGRHAAEQIGASLLDAGASVRTVDLSPRRDDGYDLTDWVLERRRVASLRTNARVVDALLTQVPTVQPKRRTLSVSTTRR